MTKKPDILQNVPLRHLQAHPEMVLELLSGEDDVSVILQKRGETVSLGAMKTWSKEAVRIAQEARAEYAELKGRGYDREDAVADLDVFRRELAKRAE